VRAVTRRPLTVSHDRLREIRCSEFTALDSIAWHFEGVDCCLFCLGTSVRNVDGEEQYREIHERYAVIAARTLLDRSPDASFVYLSGAGADRASRMMWARVKGEAEDRLAALKLARHANVRPAAILPIKPTGAARWILAPLLRIIPPLGIRAVDLGRAMLRVGLDSGWRGSRTLENRQLRAAATRQAAPRRMDVGPPAPPT
jgi:uncharacterized protein YbjT (DUF2867 family)